MKPASCNTPERLAKRAALFDICYELLKTRQLTLDEFDEYNYLVREIEDSYSFVCDYASSANAVRRGLVTRMEWEPE